MKYFFTAIISICLGMHAQAQRDCGTFEYAVQNPVLYTEDLSILQGRDTLEGERITIPVMVHVVYNNATQNISEAQINSQLEALNKDFNLLNNNANTIPAAFKSIAGSANIEFCLSGIIRQYSTKKEFSMDDDVKFASKGGSNAYKSKQYLNIWICNIKGRGLGFATAPGSPENIDGVVISYRAFGTTGTASAPFNLGRTATHELGHWLGLRHIWGDRDCGSDDIDDTPQHRSYNYGCPSFPRINNCTTTDAGEMFMNFMDFTNDACMSMFTMGQVNKMRSLFAAGGIRNGFLNAETCNYTGPVQGPAPAPVIAFPPAPVTETPGFSIQAFPNPVRNSFTLDFKNWMNEKEAWIELYNLNGKMIWKKKLNSIKSTYDISNLPAGIYVVQVYTASVQRRIRLVKI